MLNTKVSQQLKLRPDDAGGTPLEWMFRRADAEANRIVFASGEIDENNGPAQQLSVGELTVRAKAIAVHLWEHGINPGDRVAILLPNGLDYVAWVYGIMASGAIAVPLFPPDASGHGERLESVVLGAKPSMVIAAGDKENRISQLLANLGLHHCKVSDPQSVNHASAVLWTNEGIRDSGDVAFLQYTSGSTAAPKGVEVTHAGLVANSRAIAELFEHAPTTSACGVSWLPLFHDMGMVGSVFHSVHMGCPTYLMQPLDFLKRPESWLRAISHLRAESSGGPNFAYDLCVDQISDSKMEGVDLSCWKVAFNGSEPVSATTIERFNQKFSRWKFSPSSMLPCYGLAEFTLIVSGAKVTDKGMVESFDMTALAENRAVPDSHNGRPLVSSGSWIDTTQVAITKPDTGEMLNDGEVGNILVNGPDKARGYWRNSAATRALFGADAKACQGYIRTGDNGFILDNRLFVTGRTKEVIIVRGRNFYPADLEVIAQSALNGNRRLSVAAFSATGEQGEGLVIACEVSATTKEPETMARNVRLAIAEATGIQASAILLVRKSSLPKTSSGKLRRVEIAALYQRGELAEFYRDELEVATSIRPRPEIGTPYREPNSGTEQAVAAVWCAVLQMEKIGADDNFLALGGDSVRAAQIASRIGTSFGITVDIRDVFNTHTIAEVASLLDRRITDIDDDEQFIEIDL